MKSVLIVDGINLRTIPRDSNDDITLRVAQTIADEGGQIIEIYELKRVISPNSKLKQCELCEEQPAIPTTTICYACLKLESYIRRKPEAAKKILATIEREEAQR